MTEAIIVDRVSKSFGPTKALADVSLTIERGQSRGLIGKNGAGKSTLMSVLTGLVHPDSGVVRVLDEPTAGLDRAAVQRLFDQMAQAHKRGVTTIYVSHHLHEVFEVCDSVSILRDGQLVLTEQLAQLSMSDL